MQNNIIEYSRDLKVTVESDPGARAITAAMIARCKRLELIQYLYPCIDKELQMY